jgi:hypothetical protein
MPRGVSGDKSRAENLREEELQLACGLLEGIACARRRSSAASIRPTIR